MLKPVFQANNVSYTVRIYTCGCYAVGPRDIPPYCPTHIVPVPCSCEPGSGANHLEEGAHGWYDLSNV